MSTERVKIGFTGPQVGMTPFQTEQVTLWLRSKYRSPGAEFHFGDCLADEQAAKIARKIGYVIHSHPCNVGQKRKFVGADVTHPIVVPLERNWHIIAVSQYLIATPQTSFEISRGSGTWSTIRYARKVKRAHVIIYPAGGLKSYGMEKD